MLISLFAYVANKNDCEKANVIDIQVIESDIIVLDIMEKNIEHTKTTVRQNMLLYFFKNFINIIISFFFFKLKNFLCHNASLIYGYKTIITFSLDTKCFNI